MRAEQHASVVRPTDLYISKAKIGLKQNPSPGPIGHVRKAKGLER
jgi:hypothetical protein